MTKDSSSLILKAGIAYALISIIGLYALTKLSTPAAYFEASRISEVITGNDPLTAVLLGAFSGAIIAVLSEGITRFTKWGRSIRTVMRLILGRPHFMDAALLAFLSSLGEELIFRGILLPYIGIMGSSALFGLVHVVPRKRLWLWSVYATVAGLVFGVMAKETGGIIAPLVAHFVVNLTGLLALNKGLGD